MPPVAGVNRAGAVADSGGMRIALAVIVVGLLGVGFVLHERKNVLERRLGAVASQLASRSVHVHCQGVAGELVDVSAEAGSVHFDADGRPVDVTKLKRPICNALRRFRGDAASPRFDCVRANLRCDKRVFDDVLAVHTLAHESWHLRGDRDEAVTECHALQTTARAALLLGADARSADASAAYALQWFYPRMPAEYRTYECANGGPLDLRPADAHWP
jgi:hypothetical protein